MSTPDHERRGSAAKTSTFAVLRLELCAAWIAALMAVAPSALAKEKIVGVYVEGPGAPKIRDALVGALPDGLTAADAARLMQSLVAHGARAPFAKALEQNGPAHEGAAQRVRDTASAMSLDAVLVARVAKVKVHLVVRIWVIEASPDEKGPEDVILDANGDWNYDSGLKSTAEEMLAPYAKETPPTDDSKKTSTDEAAAAGPAPVDAAQAGASIHGGESPDVVSSRPHGVESRALFDAEIGINAVGRHFDYNDGLGSNLRSYDVLPAALISASVQFFPLADQKSVLRDIGLTGSYSRSLFLESSASGGVKIKTVESSISSGLRLRLHPWGDGGTIIGLSDAYTSQSVTFDSAGGSIDDQVPAVNYQANRTGADVRMPFGAFAILGGVGFRAVFGAGPVAERFRLTTVDGVDAELGAALRFAPGWEARLLADYERYFYAFRPKPGDTYVAGGALDQFFGSELALAYLF